MISKKFQKLLEIDLLFLLKIIVNRWAQNLTISLLVLSLSSFSSFSSHHISTMEGGMILTNDDELFHILLTLRAHGWTRNLPKKNLVTGEKEDDEFKESFKFVLPGYNVRPLEMSGAIGLEQLKKLPNFLKQRIKNAKLFTSLFSDHPFMRIQNQ